MPVATVNAKGRPFVSWISPWRDDRKFAWQATIGVLALASASFFANETIEVTRALADQQESLTVEMDESQKDLLLDIRESEAIQSNVQFVRQSATTGHMLSFQSLNLTHAKLDNLPLAHANFADAELVWASLRGADLTDADFAGANLNGADLTYANLTGADFANASLRKVRFRSKPAHTSRSNRTRVQSLAETLGLAPRSGIPYVLRPVEYSVDLSGMNFSGADLRFTDLNRANLSNANLRAADLSLARLGAANLAGANLRSADLELSRLPDNPPPFCYNRRTRFPDGFDPPTRDCAHWDTRRP